ncbi:MAG TPA: pyridoxal phosphate-dependent aminotransferase [Burkholderiaceae bacterium]|nr:pyridoxal phosphate-dependent aminotransferase [Burkholderiaceae bacterium]
MKLSRRAGAIEPFYVMECAKAADELARSAVCDPARGGRPMIYLNIGEPDFTATEPVREAAERCLREGRTQYTPALGLDALRERISGWYRERFGLDIPARRIVLTAGASGALQLACLALIDAGDEILMPDPSYPCNRHFVTSAGGRPVLVESGPAERFQLSAERVRAAWGERTRGVLLASPSNPTGTSIARDEMRRIVETVRAHDGITLVDEIYLGLSFDEAYGASALGLGDDVITINSFSKYFCMTGWRLGWLVVPDALVPAVERLAQNLYICPSSVAQFAALACFERESIAEYERRRAEFRARRDFLVPALDKLGLRVPVMPDGAFYAWADCSAHHASSWDFVFDLMQRAQIAITPGRDFGQADTRRYVRFSYASRRDLLEEAVARLAGAL